MSSDKLALRANRGPSVNPKARLAARSGVWLLAAISAAASAGCGVERGDLAPVRGTVTLNGDPVTHGHVFAKPASGRTAVGRIQPDGSFVLGTHTDADGAQIGEHTLTLAPPRSDEGAPPPGAVVPPTKYTSPRTSGLRLLVPVEGLTDHRIELEATEAEIRSSAPQPGFIE